MERIRRTVSTVMAVLLALNIFTGLAAAATIVEPPDVSNYKSGAYAISCTDYTTPIAYQADISPGSDADWFKCSVSSGDKIAQFIDNSYYSYVSMNAVDQNGNFVERLSYRYGDTGTGIVQASPLSTKVVNDYGNSYSGYQFFIIRNPPW